MKNWRGFGKLSKKQERNGDDPSARMDDRNLLDCGNRLRDLLVIAPLLGGDPPSCLVGRVLRNHSASVVQFANSFFIAFRPSCSDHTSAGAIGATLFSRSDTIGSFGVTSAISTGGN